MVYEGRGFRYQGEIPSENSKTSSFDDIGILVAFIGNFSIRPLSSRQILSFSTFLDTSLQRDTLMNNFTLLLQDQLIEASAPTQGILEFLLTRPEYHNRE